MIRSLDEAVTLQIGSSQVITSIDQAIKELIENAIDAQTDKIEIYCDEKSVKVTDCGNGISKENMTAIGKRHCTSKLKDYDDLQKIRTFGFRGEALSSMCCTCDVEITTATSGPLGTKLVYDKSGKVVSMDPVARQKGTTVKLSNIFEKFPVRLYEFQKNIKREFSKVHDLVLNYCVAFPSIRFSLTILHKRKDIVETDGLGSVPNTLSKLMCTPVKNLLEIKCESKSFSVQGWITKPAGLNGRGHTDGQFYFINTRPVNLPAISKAINNTFREYNSQQYPVCALFIQISEDLIDRNCSPDKYNVFLENKQLILQNIVDALIRLFEPTRGELNFAIPSKPLTQVVSQKPNTVSKTFRKSNVRKIIGRDSKKQLKIGLNQIQRNSTLKQSSPYLNLICPKELKIPTTLTKEDFSKLNIIGQYNKGFILAFYESKLFIIDQHASDEKNMYEYFQRSKVTVQRLITPTVLNLTPLQMSFVENFQKEFLDRGFELQLMQDQWALCGVPQIRSIVLGVVDFEDCLAKLMQSQSATVPVCSRLERFFASKACRSAVMIGDTLNMSKMKSIVEQMANLVQPWNCPHGRPTIRLLAIFNTIPQSVLQHHIGEK